MTGEEPECHELCAGCGSPVGEEHDQRCPIAMAAQDDVQYRKWKEDTER